MGQFRWARRFVMGLLLGAGGLAMAACHEGPATAALGDFVWHDANENGIQDIGEPGIPGVRVTLSGTNRVGTAVFRTTSTDDGGAYSFENLEAGTYRVALDPPAGLRFTTPNVGADRTADSDVDPATERTPDIVLAVGERNTGIDAGLVGSGTGTIGDLVWHDWDGNGIQLVDEPGVPDVAVTLLAADGTELAVTTTGANGRYQFPELIPGTYRVRFAAPAGLAFTTPNAGENGDVDSDADAAVGETAAITLADGQIADDVDAGLVRVPSGDGLSIGGAVWRDTDGNGIRDPIEPTVADIDVELLDATGSVLATTTSAAFGFYEFPGIAPGDYRVGFVAPDGSGFTALDQGGDDRFDSDADPVTGETGIITLVDGQSDLTVDAGVVGLSVLGGFVWDDLDGDGFWTRESEPGVSEVEVRLLDSDGVELAAALTGTFGRYEFVGLSHGEYRVRFLPPPGFGFTTQSDAPGTDFLESSPDPASGETPVITLGPGESTLRVSAGLVPVVADASVGDLVWEDLNGDGIHDPGEPGLAGVTVRLLDIGDAELAVTITDDAGLYQFAGLAAGDYRVRFEAPAGLAFTAADAGTDDALDSDPDPATGETAVITVAPGQVDDTVDAGLVPMSPDAAIGDLVWEDFNGDGIQGPGEPGLQGIVVTLLDQSGAQTASAVTDASGFYEFTGLTPGTYRLRFADMREAGLFFTVPNAGSDDTVDSDADPATRVTDPVVVAAGQSNDTVDAGYRRLS